MLTNAFDLIAKILSIILWISVGYCVWRLLVSSFKGKTAFPESYIDNPYIFMKRKERKTHLDFLSKVHVYNPNTIEDYLMIKSGKEHYIDYILFLPNIASIEKTDIPDEMAMRKVADSLVSPGKLKEEEIPIAVGFASELHQVQGVKYTVACYRHRQHLTASEYNEAQCEVNHSDHSLNPYIVCMEITIAIYAVICAVNLAMDAYLGFSPLIFVELKCYLLIALLFCLFFYRQYSKAGNISVLKITLIAALYTVCVICLNNLWHYMSLFWIKERYSDVHNLYFSVLWNDLQYHIGLSEFRYPVVFFVSFLGLWLEKTLLSFVKHKREHQLREEIELLQCHINMMIANWDSTIHRLFLWGDKKYRTNLVKGAEKLFYETHTDRQVIHTTGADMLDLLQDGKFLPQYADNSLLIIEDIDTFLASNSIRQEMLFDIVHQMLSHDGKIILTSSVRPADIEDLSERNLMQLDCFCVKKV